MELPGFSPSTSDDDEGVDHADDDASDARGPSPPYSSDEDEEEVGV